MSNKQDPLPLKPSSLKNFLKSLIGYIKPKQHTLEETVNEYIADNPDNLGVHEEERTILKNFLKFGDLEAADLMIPRTDIVSASVNSSLLQLKKIFLKEGHSRLPIYKNTIDEIEGFIHIKDLLKALSDNNKSKLKDITRDIIFVPTTMKVTDLLTRMKQSKIHIAIVLDEYGGTDGLITIEDVVEGLFGDIEDEYDAQETSKTIRKDGSDAWIVDAKVEIEELENAIGTKIVEDSEDLDYDTLGGFIITYLGQIPKSGHKFTHPNGTVFEILDASTRRIKAVRLSKD